MGEAEGLTMLWCLEHMASLYNVIYIIILYTHIFGQTAKTSSNLTLNMCFSREAKHGLNLGC